MYVLKKDRNNLQDATAETVDYMYVPENCVQGVVDFKISEVAILNL